MDVVPPDFAEEAETSRTTNRTSARSARVEILTRPEPRRSWTAEQKRQIVGESLGPDLTPTEVARKYRISTGQIYTWRQQLLDLRRSSQPRAPVQFAAVELTAASPSALPEPPCSEMSVPTSASPPPVRLEGIIEILLPGGVSLRVDAQVDVRALRRVLNALESR
jgi:transposase